MREPEREAATSSVRAESPWSVAWLGSTVAGRVEAGGTSASAVLGERRVGGATPAGVRRVVRRPAVGCGVGLREGVGWMR